MLTARASGNSVTGAEIDGARHIERVGEATIRNPDHVRGGRNGCRACGHALRKTNHELPGPEEWLLIDWSQGESEPRHYGLGAQYAGTTRDKLVRTAQCRWRFLASGASMVNADTLRLLPSCASRNR